MKTKSIINLAAGLLISLAVSSNLASAEAKQADCLLIVKSEIIFQGKCEFRPTSSDGSFQIARGNVFADVGITTPGMAIGNWTGPQGASHAHNSLGELKRDFRDPACWANDNARVCAR